MEEELKKITEAISIAELQKVIGNAKKARNRLKAAADKIEATDPYYKLSQEYSEKLKEPEIIINGKPVQFNEDNTFCDIYGFAQLNKREIESIYHLLDIGTIELKSTTCKASITHYDIPALKEILKRIK